MSRLESLVGTHVSSYSTEIFRTLELYTNKPLLFKTQSDALMQSMHAPLLYGVRNQGITLGVSSTIILATDLHLLLTSLQEHGINPETDVAAGLAPPALQASGKQHIASLSTDHELFLSFQSLLGASSGENSILGRSSFCSALLWRWNIMPIKAEIQAAFFATLAESRIGWRDSLNPIVESISIDLDSDGPLTAQNFNFVLNPSFSVALKSVGIGLGTDLIYRLIIDPRISISFRLSALVAKAYSHLVINAESDLEILGYLSSLIEKNGRIKIQGTTSPVHTDLFAVRTGVELALYSWPTTIVLPIYYLPPQGLSIGLQLCLDW